MATISSPYRSNWPVSVANAAAAAGRRPVHRPICVVHSEAPNMVGSCSANLDHC